jgi:hypothetical protein
MYKEFNIIGMRRDHFFVERAPKCIIALNIHPDVKSRSIKVNMNYCPQGVLIYR